VYDRLNRPPARLVPLCRYEELAQRENRQREARASRSIDTTQKLSGDDDLKSAGVDIPDDLPGAER